MSETSIPADAVLPVPAKDERADAIMARVRASGFQQIDALAALFCVTPQTIRRDVNHLCNRGLLRRRHGGVELPPTEENLAYSARRVLHLDAKRRIAAEVALHVPSGASLFFGIGTTPEQCARALVDHAGLRVMTNNLNVAMALSRNPDTEITIAGGRLRNLDCDVIAGESHGFFARYSVDIGIFGVASVGADGGLLDFDSDEVRMRLELASNCRRRFLVFDHSKLGRRALVRGGHITDADMVFTDRPLPAAIELQLRDRGVQLVLCGEAAGTGFADHVPPPCSTASHTGVRHVEDHVSTHADDRRPGRGSHCQHGRRLRPGKGNLL